MILPPYYPPYYNRPWLELLLLLPLIPKAGEKTLEYAKMACNYSKKMGKKHGKDLAEWESANR